MNRRRICPPTRATPGTFAGFRFPPEVILLAVRWYLRFGLSYRDLEELLAERGIEVDHVTLFRWVQRFTPQLVEATRFFAVAIGAHGEPVEVTTDRAPALARPISELLPGALHATTQYANNRVEADHGRLKARLRPMRGLKRDHTASVIIAGHAFIQNLRRGHYELGKRAINPLVVATAFDELAPSGLSPTAETVVTGSRPAPAQRNRAELLTYCTPQSRLRRYRGGTAGTRRA